MFNIKPRLLEITAANVGEKKDKRRAVSGLLVHAVLLRVKGGGGRLGLQTRLFIEVLPRRAGDLLLS